MKVDYKNVNLFEIYKYKKVTLKVIGYHIMKKKFMLFLPNVRLKIKGDGVVS